MEFFIIYGIAFGVITALAANARGRSGFGWFFLGAIFGIFALLAVLVMENLKKSGSN